MQYICSFINLTVIFFIHFSFDVRGRPFTKALYWSDSNAFGPRAYFVTGPKPAGLTLESVQLDDEGIYRCRVDFKNSPTRNFQINLTVIGKSDPHIQLVYRYFKYFDTESFYKCLYIP